MFLECKGFKDLNFLAKEEEEIEEKVKNLNLEEQKKEGEQEVEVKSRSLKEKLDTIQISFELDFLNQHSLAFHEQQKNFIETVLKQSDSSNLTFLAHSLFFPHPVTSPFQSPLPVLIDENYLLSYQQKRQFIKDLETQDKLKEFLEIVNKTAVKEVSTEIIYLSFLIWEKYIEIRRPLLKIRDISIMAENFAQKNANSLFSDAKMNFLTFKHVKAERKNSCLQIREGFEYFVRFLCETIFLVVEEFFENPYFESEGKREREEEMLNNLEEENEILLEELGCCRMLPTKIKKLY